MTRSRERHPTGPEDSADVPGSPGWTGPSRRQDEEPSRGKGLRTFHKVLLVGVGVVFVYHVLVLADAIPDMAGSTERGALWAILLMIAAVVLVLGVIGGGLVLAIRSDGGRGDGGRGGRDPSARSGRPEDPGPEDAGSGGDGGSARRDDDPGGGSVGGAAPAGERPRERGRRPRRSRDPVPPRSRGGRPPASERVREREKV